jgi:hypothetical protein
MAAKRNPFADNNVMTFATNVVTVGATAATSVVATRQLADRFAPRDTSERTKTVARAAVHIYAGWKLKRRYPRIGAGLAIGGGVLLFDQFARTQVEQQLTSLLAAPSTSSSSSSSGGATGGGALPAPRRREDDRIQWREAEREPAVGSAWR